MAGEETARYRLVGEVSPEGEGQILFKHQDGNYTECALDRACRCSPEGPSILLPCKSSDSTSHGVLSDHTGGGL